MSAHANQLPALEARRDEIKSQATALLERRKAAGVEELTGADAVKFRAMANDLRDLEYDIAEIRTDRERGTIPSKFRGLGGGGEGGGIGAEAFTKNWAHQTLRMLKRSLGGAEERAVISGSVDVPVLVEPEVVATPFRKRLIDAYGQKRTAESTAIEYFVQSARTNNAAPVADLAQKPTTVLTVTPVVDRCRVVATLSEPLPLRIWTDEQAIVSWLTSQLAGSVLDEIETQTISGDGRNENFRASLTPRASTRSASTPTRPPRCGMRSPCCRTSASARPAGR
jgi:HK97 family phage major capsid protein